MVLYEIVERNVMDILKEMIANIYEKKKVTTIEYNYKEQSTVLSFVELGIDNRKVFIRINYDDKGLPISISSDYDDYMMAMFMYNENWYKFHFVIKYNSITRYCENDGRVHEERAEIVNRKASNKITIRNIYDDNGNIIYVNQTNDNLTIIENDPAHHLFPLSFTSIKVKVTGRDLYEEKYEYYPMVHPLSGKSLVESIEYIRNDSPIEMSFQYCTKSFDNVLFFFTFERFCIKCIRKEITEDTIIVTTYQFEDDYMSNIIFTINVSDKQVSIDRLLKQKFKATERIYLSDIVVDGNNMVFAMQSKPKKDIILSIYNTNLKENVLKDIYCDKKNNNLVFRSAVTIAEENYDIHISDDNILYFSSMDDGKYKVVFNETTNTGSLCYMCKIGKHYLPVFTYTKDNVEVYEHSSDGRVMKKTLYPQCEMLYEIHKYNTLFSFETKYMGSTYHLRNIVKDTLSYTTTWIL